MSRSQGPIVAAGFRADFAARLRTARERQADRRGSGRGRGVQLFGLVDVGVRAPSPQAGLAPGYRPGGQSPPRGPSAWLSHALGERSLIFLSPVVFSPCRRSTAGNSASWSSCRGHRPGNVPPVVLTIDAGKRAESGQAGHRPGNVPRGFRGADVPPVVPTIDAGQFQGQADGGQAGHRPGKRRGLPADGPFARAGAFRVT